MSVHRLSLPTPTSLSVIKCYMYLKRVGNSHCLIGSLPFNPDIRIHSDVLIGTLIVLTICTDNCERRQAQEGDCADLS